MDRKEVCHSAQSRQCLWIVNGNRFFRDIPTGHDQGLKTAGSKEQMVDRSVRQENAVLTVERCDQLAIRPQSFLRSSTMGRSGLSSKAREASSSSQRFRTASKLGAIIANGFSTRRFPSRRRLTAAGFVASTARWNPPKPFTATT